MERLTGADNGAHEGEHWKVTGVDGTQYFFGLGRNPDTDAGTGSALLAPVFADHEGEPCRGENEFHVCTQAWRWNLDRVVDPDGNVTTYYYHRSTNRYAALNGLINGVQYNHGARIDRIEYGAREGTDGSPTARVTFGRQYRCNDLNANCPRPDGSNADRFPDVPNDLICTDENCAATSPSFFSPWRFTHVKTEVRVGGEWQPVLQYNLQHQFWGMIPSTNKLYLAGVQQHGFVDGDWFVYPSTTFSHASMPNRVDMDNDAGIGGQYHRRIARVTNPFGGRTDITYGQHRPCDESYAPSRWSLNDRDCFPQTVYDNQHRRTGLFHKYLVTEIREDPRASGPEMVTTYEYEGRPAWGFNPGSFAFYDHYWGWSNWRGYHTTRITQGSSETRVRVFRGLHGDLTLHNVGGSNETWGPRHEALDNFDGSESYLDLLPLAGRTSEEQVFGTVDGVDGQVAQSTLYTYEHRETHEIPGDNDNTEWAGLSSVTESVATAPGEFRQRGGTTTYNDRLQPETSVELGWFDVDGDERCSATTYAENEDAWMFVYPASNLVVAGEDCDGGEILSESEIYYDGSDTLGAAPSRGNPTRQRTRLDDDSWSETTTEFDDLGRPVAVTDPNGATTTTTYVASPAHAVPSETTVTNDVGHSATTVWQPETGLPLREEDANGNRTAYAYDAFGRLTSVWSPTEPTSGDPTWRFAYFPSEDRRMVRSAQLVVGGSGQSGSWYDLTWAFYDGFWRERQTQVYAPVGNQRILSEVRYDDRGLVRLEGVPQAVAGAPGTPVWLTEFENSTRYSYDELGRTVRQEWLQGSDVAHETVTEHGADWVMVTGPDGSRARESVDGLGRTVSVEEHDGDDWVTSTYAYDLADRLVSASDPKGNTVEYTYDMGGRQLTQVDPNRGTAASVYDAAGNRTSVVDGVGNEVHTVYDALGRPVERRADAVDGDLLAAWEYDAPGALGMPSKEITYTDVGEWVSEVVGYDARGRAEGSTLVVPDGVPGLSGEYTVTQEYDVADRMVSVSYPEMAGLPAETVTTTYDALGLARSMVGLEEYVWDVAYDDRGRRTAAGYGPRPAGEPWMARSWEYNADQQLAAMETWVDGDGVVSSHELGFDVAGNLVERSTVQNGLTWRECYEHDGRHRLVGAFTVDAGNDCDDGDPGTGDRPYEHSFSYSIDGNLLERVEDGETFEYTYPDAGELRPHAPVEVDGDTYSWDDNGNLVERTVGGGTETFSWNTEQRLESVDGPDGTTDFVYDSGGQRLLRETDDEVTLYLGGHELTASADGETVSGVRPYSFGGELVAIRTNQGVSYMAGNEAGSVELQIDSSGDVTGDRSYAPYGQVREEDGEMDTDRGFIGQIEDSTTNLSYLNARYYDTTIGVFISTDPIYDTHRPKTLNPYSYAGGNPTTYTDPDGLSPSYIHGIERENKMLRQHNSQLQSHIGKLEGHIGELQGIIRKQSREINRLMTHITALNAIIRQQQGLINKLNAEVRRLTTIVNQQRIVIGQLQAKVAQQQRTISVLRGRVAYYQNVADQLACYIWCGTGGYDAVFLSIHSGRGVPSGAYSTTRLTISEANATALQADVDDLTVRLWQGGGSSQHVTALNRHIGRLEGDVARLERQSGRIVAQINDLGLTQGRAGPSGSWDWDGSNLNFTWGRGGSGCFDNLWKNCIHPNLTLESALGCANGALEYGQAGAQAGALMGPKSAVLAGAVGAGLGCVF